MTALSYGLIFVTAQGPWRLRRTYHINTNNMWVWTFTGCGMLTAGCHKKKFWPPYTQTWFNKKTLYQPPFLNMLKEEPKSTACVGWMGHIGFCDTLAHGPIYRLYMPKYGFTWVPCGAGNSSLSHLSQSGIIPLQHLWDTSVSLWWPGTSFTNIV